VYYKLAGQSSYRNKTINNEATLSTDIKGFSAYSEVCVKLAAFTSVGLSKNWEQEPCAKIRTQQAGQWNFILTLSRLLAYL